MLGAGRRALSPDQAPRFPQAVRVGGGRPEGGPRPAPPPPSLPVGPGGCWFHASYTVHKATPRWPPFRVTTIHSRCGAAPNERAVAKPSESRLHLLLCAGGRLPAGQPRRGRPLSHGRHPCVAVDWPGPAQAGGSSPCEVAG